MADKKFEKHMMYGDGKAETADTFAEHLKLKKKGYGHKKPPFKMNGFPVHAGISPMTFKGANSSNSSCWPGYGPPEDGPKTKKSPSGTGERVNNCVKK